VPTEAAEMAARYVPVRPRGEVLHIAQHRVREKTFLQKHGFPVAPFAVVRSSLELQHSLARIGCPAVLKTAGWGYDGKGQTLIQESREADAAWLALDADEAVLEGFIPFDRELSVVIARSVDGSVATYGPIENDHQNHVLDISCSPAFISEQIRTQAIDMSREVAEKLDVVGVLCVEMFFTHDHQLLINELAPRPHNSGHLTIDAHVTCQFEQQVRAVCGLPLGSTHQHRPAVMANLLGKHLPAEESGWTALHNYSGVKLHLYGKRKPVSGRKMGHLTVLADSTEEARSLILAARQSLNSSRTDTEHG